MIFMMQKSSCHYCTADNFDPAWDVCIPIDLDFFEQMNSELGSIIYHTFQKTQLVTLCTIFRNFCQACVSYSQAEVGEACSVPRTHVYWAFYLPNLHVRYMFLRGCWDAAAKRLPNVDRHRQC